MKIAMIGCGGIAREHLGTILAEEGTEVVACASTNRTRGLEMAKRAGGARVYANADELYSGERELDAAFICVPPDAHGAPEILAARRGIHCYIEKPIALTMEEAERISSVIDDSGIIASAGYQERYRSSLARMRAYLMERKVGMASAVWMGGVPTASWWRRRECSGGQVVEQATHLFDLLRWFFGEASTVYSAARRGIVQGMPDYSIDDGSVTTVAFNSGVLASVLTGCFLEAAAPHPVGLSVMCSDSSVEYSLGREVVIRASGCEERIAADEDAHARAVRAFLHAVKAGETECIGSPYNDAMRTLELTLAANRSMETGVPVMLSQA